MITEDNIAKLDKVTVLEFAQELEHALTHGLICEDMSMSEFIELYMGSCLSSLNFIQVNVTLHSDSKQG